MAFEPEELVYRGAFALGKREEFPSDKEDQLMREKRLLLPQ